MTTAVQIIDYAAMAIGDRHALAELHEAVWVGPDRDREKLASQDPPTIDWPHHHRPQAHVIRDRGVIIALATSKPRRIRTSEGDLDVLALANVSCHPRHQGHGYGAAVVRSAFERVDRGDFPVSFFQTAIPDFYRKLGCRTVDNPVVNSHSTIDRQIRPFWDDNALIYPADFDWPGGPIDTLGPGW